MYKPRKGNVTGELKLMLENNQINNKSISAKTCISRILMDKVSHKRFVCAIHVGSETIF